jgi:hypothetical protein
VKSDYEDPPFEIIHAPELLTPRETMAMLWSQYKSTYPPGYMKHSPHLKSADGLTILDYWNKDYVPPKWMLGIEEPKYPTIGCNHVEELSCLTKEGKVVCDKCSTGEVEQIIKPHVCGICQNAFILNREVVIYRPCKHICCKECAKNWYRINKTCPYCKIHITKF